MTDDPRSIEKEMIMCTSNTVHMIVDTLVLISSVTPGAEMSVAYPPEPMPCVVVMWGEMWAVILDAPTEEQYESLRAQFEGVPFVSVDNDHALSLLCQMAGGPR